MKVVLLAGGFGTRISEESHLRPKPMIEIGGKPILWHIMKIYSHFGLNDFIICAGYKAYFIKEYFLNYFVHNSDISVDLVKNQIHIHNSKAEPWRVTVVDTGENTMTGGRLKRIASYLDEEDFCLTYGDGLSNINISELISFHKAHGRLATITAVSPPGRFGHLRIDEKNEVQHFVEKPDGDETKINGGFFVLSPKVLNYIEGDETVWEISPLEKLSSNQELQAFLHNGFWQPMDTLRDKIYLEELWKKEKAPWKIWK